MNIKKMTGLTYQRTLFPAPAIREENIIGRCKKRRGCKTHVSHGSIKGSLVLGLVRTNSILKGCYFQQTMPPFQCVAIHGQDYDFSTDRVERANLERLGVSCRLQDYFSDFAP
jgi:hypothetical protein